MIRVEKKANSGGDVEVCAVDDGVSDLNLSLPSAQLSRPTHFPLSCNKAHANTWLTFRHNYTLAYLAMPFLASDTEAGVLQGAWNSAPHLQHNESVLFNPMTAQITEKSPLEPFSSKEEIILFIIELKGISPTLTTR